MGGAIQAHKSKTRLCANCNRTWRVGRAILESTQRNTRLCANCNSGRAHRSGRAAAHEVGVGGVRVRDNDVRAGRAVGRVHLLHQLRHEHVRGPVSPSTHRVKVQTARILSLKFQHAPRAARARWSRGRLTAQQETGGPKEGSARTLVCTAQLSQGLSPGAAPASPLLLARDALLGQLGAVGAIDAHDTRV